eukprot:Gb_05673 [translate_table: standard]
MENLVEQTEKYGEMVELMKNVTKLDVEMTVEERKFLSVDYENAINASKASWWINLLNRKKKPREISRMRSELKITNSNLNELSKICNDILTIID